MALCQRAKSQAQAAPQRQPTSRPAAPASQGGDAVSKLGCACTKVPLWITSEATTVTGLRVAAVEQAADKRRQTLHHAKPRIW